MNRRTFLFLTGASLLAPGTLLRKSNGGRSRAQFLGQSPLNQHLDLEEVTTKLELCSQQLASGVGPDQVHDAIQELSASVWRQVATEELSLLDPVVAETVWNVDILLAAVQEATLGWWKDRPHITGETYSRLTNMLALNSHQRLELPRVRLDVRRAVLQREGRQPAQAERILQVSTAGLAHEQMDGNEHAALLMVASRCQLIHTHAIQGRQAAWHREISTLQEEVEHTALTIATKHRLHNIILYARGVGYKRFMWINRDLPKDRTRLAQAAYSSLDQLQSEFNGAMAVHDINLYHSSLPFTICTPELTSSSLDALVWLWPEEAERQLLLLKRDAITLYPSLLRKIDAQLNLAHLLQT